MMLRCFKYVFAIMGFLLIIVVFSFHKDPSLNGRIKELKFERQTIYLIQRGTTGKLGGLAKDFNIRNLYASHLGIGFLENNTLKIYHVYVDKNRRQNNLYVENISEFIKPEDLNYLSIWQLQDIDRKQFNDIRAALIESEKQNILFDFNFNESNNAYYCSEYIVEELKKSNIEIMKDHKKSITGMARQILKRDTLTYYPVDGFENTGKAAKIFEWIK